MEPKKSWLQKVRATTMPGIKAPAEAPKLQVLGIFHVSVNMNELLAPAPQVCPCLSGSVWGA